MSKHSLQENQPSDSVYFEGAHTAPWQRPSLAYDEINITMRMNTEHFAKFGVELDYS